MLPVRLASPMLIRRESGDGSWHSPHTTAYTNEAELRDLLVETPSLLPGVDERAVAAKELPISGVGSADVVVVDASGEITVVECKLRANPEIRRRVIGQLLAYSSGIWRMSFATFDDAFRRSEARQSLSDALVGGSDVEEEDFRRAVEDNLMSGSMRLIIAVDEITDELKRIVSYLNSHTTANVELLALEMRRAVGDGVEVLVPAVYGEESAGTRTVRDERLDRETLVASICEQSEPAAAAAEGILDWADREPRLDVRYTRTSVVRLWAAGKQLLQIDRGGQLRVILQSLSEHGEPWDAGGIERLVQDLAEIGVQLEPKRTWPKTALEPLADDTRRQQFFTLMDRVLDTLRTSD